MDKILKTILNSERSEESRFCLTNLGKVLISSIAIFGVGFLFAPSTFAQAQNLIVQFEQTPLFNEANFLPGQDVTRWVKITNNSGQTQRIATEAINKNDLNHLGDVLNLEIKEGGTTRYNDALSKFFTAGEVFLSNLASGSTTQYDFIISFYSGTQNPFQGKTLGFDILVGFQGTEGGLLPGAGGGGGGYLPAGLTIQNESVRITVVGETSVTITWLTSYFSTSQVIYALEGEKHTLDLTDTTGTPPKYGYERTTPEYDASLKVTAHSVTITGLTPGTKYYYRTVSHGSLAISQEYSFVTKGVAGAIEGIVPSETGGEVAVSTPFTELFTPLTGEEKPEGLAEQPTEGEAVTGAEKKPFTETLGEKGFLAAIGLMPLATKIILIIIGAIIVGLGGLMLFRKKTRKKLM